MKNKIVYWYPTDLMDEEQIELLRRMEEETKRRKK